MFKVLIQLACISFGGDPGWDDPVSFFLMESSILYLVDMDKFILVFCLVRAMRLNGMNDVLRTISLCYLWDLYLICGDPYVNYPYKKIYA